MKSIVGRLHSCSRRELFLLALAAGAAVGMPAASHAFNGPRVSFRLLGPDSRVVTEADFLGYPGLVVFGFMSCPDVCPTTLLELAQFLRDLGPIAEKIRVAFISVDPDRDRISELGPFVANFDSRILALSGSREAVKEAVESFHAIAEIIPQGDSYTIAHSVGIYVLDKGGYINGFLDLTSGSDKAASQIKALL